MIRLTPTRVYGLRDVIAKWDSLPIEAQLEAAKLWPERIEVRIKPATGRLFFEIADISSDFFDQHPAWRN